MRGIITPVVLFISMATRKLPHYLRAERRRAALTQEEVAFLLGRKGHAKISEYEVYATLPSLHAALGFEAIFGTPVRELLAGVYEEIERDVRKRAEKLAKKLYTENPNAKTARKLGHLRAIIFGPEIVAENPLVANE